MVGGRGNQYWLIACCEGPADHHRLCVKKSREREERGRRRRTARHGRLGGGRACAGRKERERCCKRRYSSFHFCHLRVAWPMVDFTRTGKNRLRMRTSDFCKLKSYVKLAIKRKQLSDPV